MFIIHKNGRIFTEKQKPEATTLQVDWGTVCSYGWSTVCHAPSFLQSTPRLPPRRRWTSRPGRCLCFSWTGWEDWDLCWAAGERKKDSAHLLFGGICVVSSRWNLKISIWLFKVFATLLNLLMSVSERLFWMLLRKSEALLPPWTLSRPSLTSVWELDVSPGGKKKHRSFEKSQRTLTCWSLINWENICLMHIVVIKQ